jgi:hypothetical protein
MDKSDGVFLNTDYSVHRCTEAALADLVASSGDADTMSPRAAAVAEAYLDFQPQSLRMEPAMAEAVPLLLNFWSQQNLPAETLEKILVARKYTVASAIVACFSAPACAWTSVLESFSAESILSFYQVILSATPGDSQASKEMRGPKVSEDRLWTEITAHLQHGPLSRLSIPLQAVSSSSEALDDPGAEERVVFSCRHSWARKVFTELVVPEFGRRVKVGGRTGPGGCGCDAVPDPDAPNPSLLSLSQAFPIPVSAALLVEGYFQKFMPLACPHCVFAHLKQQHETHHPDMPAVPSWPPPG